MITRCRYLSLSALMMVAHSVMSLPANSGKLHQSRYSVALSNLTTNLSLTSPLRRDVYFPFANPVALMMYSFKCYYFRNRAHSFGSRLNNSGGTLAGRYTNKLWRSGGGIGIISSNTNNYKIFRKKISKISFLTKTTPGVLVFLQNLPGVFIYSYNLFIS